MINPSAGAVKLTQSFPYLGRDEPMPEQTITDLEATVCARFVLKSVKLTMPRLHIPVSSLSDLGRLGSGSGEQGPRRCSAFTTFAGVIGRSKMRTPIASATALAMADATGVDRRDAFQRLVGHHLVSAPGVVRPGRAKSCLDANMLF